MFTGIVQKVGEVESISYQQDKARIRIHAGELSDTIKLGDSVAVSGVCLTASALGPGWIEFDAVTTTLKITRLKELKRGSKVNLEPALRFGDPLGGHLVSGHVDGVGAIQSIQHKPGETRIRVDAPSQVLQFLIERGSVALDGVSLTVAGLHKDGFEIAVIPHTLAETTLKDAKKGDPVNLEGDMIGKWVAKYVKNTQNKGGLTWEKLEEEGFYNKGL